MLNYSGETNSAPLNCILDAETFSINFCVMYILDTIFFSKRQNYMDFWIQICSDYHLNSIYNIITVASGWFCFVMSLSMPYVCIVSLRVFACISTWALVY